MTADAGDPVGTQVRDAATVVLLRDGGKGPEVWLLTRAQEMAFAAGMSVFPGGRMDAADADLPLVGADVDDVACRLDCTAELAHALLGCAARETFEETGVLLTVPPAHLPGVRDDVEAGRLAFGGLLAEHGLAIDAAALQPWARWITPASEMRRYDARFFVARVPGGATASNASSESSAAAWVPIALALEQAERGERGLLPPTLVTLTALHAFSTVDDVLAAAAGRRVEPTRPVVRWSADDEPAVELPDGSLVPLPRSLFGRDRTR